MVPTLKINLGENYGICHQVQHIIKTENGEAILNSDFVDCVDIHKHTPCVVLLWCQKCWNCTQAQIFSDESLVK